MKYVIPACALIALFAFTTAQLAAGFAGIEHGAGQTWAIAAVSVALLLRFTLPITIGAFFGAMQLWGWHWTLALLFTVPGLLFIVPGVLPAIASLTIHGASRLTRATPICEEH